MDYCVTALFLFLNADVVAKFHRVWRRRLMRRGRAVDWTAYDQRLEAHLRNLCVRYPWAVRVACDTFDHEGERQRAERLVRREDARAAFGRAS